MSHALTEAATRLADLLARENAALAACDLRGAAALLGQKQDAATAFARAVSEPLAGPPDPALQAIGARLAAAATENRRLLERGIAVQSRVLAMIARAAPRSTIAPGYGSQAASVLSRAAPVALAVRV